MVININFYSKSQAKSVNKILLKRRIQLMMKFKVLESQGNLFVRLFTDSGSKILYFFWFSLQVYDLKMR